MDPNLFTGLRAFILQHVDLSERELDEVCKHFTLRRLKANDFFTSKGEICDKIAFIRQGYMRSFYDIKDTEVTKLIFSRHMIVTAFASFTSRQPSKEYIQAITDCELLVIHHDAMQYLYNKFPKWERLGRLIMEQAYQITEARVLSFLTQSAEERYRNLVNTQPQLVKNVPLAYIASMLGITPETLSRIRNRIKQEASELEKTKKKSSIQLKG